MNMFNSVQVRKPGRSKFDLSHEKKLTTAFGYLAPINCIEILPGDKMRVNSEIYLRMMPMLAPIMHRCNVTVHHFFVPTRLIWDEFQDWITGGPDGDLAPVAPFLPINTTNVNHLTQPGSVGDFLGLPLLPDATVEVPLNISALPFRAYQMIYNEYYRDQNVTDPVVFGIGSGSANADVLALGQIRYRAWKKDYFTSALPFAQRGAEVTIPIGGFNNVPLLVNPLNSGTSSAVVSGIEQPGSTGVGFTVDVDNTFGTNGRIYAKTSDLVQTSSTINDLRNSIRLQEWLEKNARGGARYVEQIYAHFGVRSSDARLQRPEYLGGGRGPVQISEVMSTVQLTTADGSAPIGNPQATPAGRGTAYMNRNGFKRFFEEHGYMMSIMSISPEPAYQQGIHKMFSRLDKFDTYFPEFANIGEQEIKMKELYYDGQTGSLPESTFGYQSRYAEYKYLPSTVHGQFRSTLAFWHLGRIFQNEPTLNTDFMQFSGDGGDLDGLNRIFAVSDTSGNQASTIICQIMNNISAVRLMPYYGTPML